jgi:excisionase family DNA binding protein
MVGFRPDGRGAEADAPLLTVRAAADPLGIAYSTLKRWVHTGRVRTTRTEGGHHRVSSAEIERLLARPQPDEKRRRTTDVDESLGGLSARNRLHGFIEEVRVDGLLAQVRDAGRQSVPDRGHHRLYLCRPLYLLLVSLHQASLPAKYAIQRI